MPEKIISLEGADPRELFGPHNSLLERIKQAFPKLKIIARGNELKVVGDQAEISRFEQHVRSFLKHLDEFNRITGEDIDNLLVNNVPRTDGQDNKEQVIIHGIDGRPIRARTANQARLVQEQEKHDLVLAIGPAGTGKTYTAIALAVKALKNKQVKRIILTRPAVEAGEHLGFLPGDVREKLDPYLQPLYDALRDMIHYKKLSTYLEDETIQIAPLAFMRGRTLENAFVILDEGQNATVNQLKMFLTRMGMNAKFIVTGDITQIDLPGKHQSGLLQAIHILEPVSGVSIVYFGTEDIVRHPLVRDIVNAYGRENDNGGNNADEDKSENENTKN
ncbi:MAG: PhoH family protein [Chlorobi bacterium]|nr:PhoH family protein [Chlorobiota bacterium]